MNSLVPVEIAPATEFLGTERAFARLRWAGVSETVSVSVIKTGRTYLRFQDAHDDSVRLKYSGRIRTDEKDSVREKGNKCAVHSTSNINQQQVCDPETLCSDDGQPSWEQERIEVLGIIGAGVLGRL